MRCGRALARAPRLGILGSGIAQVRSPRVHPQPFDRIDVPAGTDVAALVDVLRPYYRGFAVTSPFKQRFGQPGAINTLVRREGGWLAVNTDFPSAGKAT